MPNGESIRREWLVRSDNCKALFCFSCCLFNKSPPSQAQSLFSHPKLAFRGKWKKLYKTVKSHEQSTTHIINYVKWKDLEVALEKQSGIDDQHQRKINEEKQR